MVYIKKLIYFHDMKIMEESKPFTLKLSSVNLQETFGNPEICKLGLS